MNDWERFRPQVPAVPNKKAVRKAATGTLDKLAEKYGVVTDGAVFIALDCSGSMSIDDKLQLAKAGAMDYARAADGYQIGLVSFGSSATLHLALSHDRAALQRAMDAIQVEGLTDMAGALQVVDQQFPVAGATSKQVLLVVTDGMPTDPETTLQNANALKQRRIEIRVIGTKDADWDFLKRLASTADMANSVEPSQLRLTIASEARALPRFTGR